MGFVRFDKVYVQCELVDICLICCLDVLCCPSDLANGFVVCVSKPNYLLGVFSDW